MTPSGAINDLFAHDASSDILLLLPEILLTSWFCLILIVDFSFPRLPNEQLAYFSIAGLVATLGCLAWFDITGITGTLFADMFALDRMALFFKMFVVGRGQSSCCLASIDYVSRFRFFKGILFPGRDVVPSG